MKNTLYLSIILLLLTFSSCSKKIYTSPEILSEINNTGDFTFMAERANPLSNDVVNILSSYPRGSQGILNLDLGYVLTVKDKKLTVDLPYFGRLFTPSMDPDKNSFKFETENYSVNKTQNSRGNLQYLINAKDQSRNITFTLEIFGNGKAYLNASSNDRQGISYDGYMKKPAAENLN